MENPEKKAKTLMLLMVYVAMGLCYQIAGPTLIDLKLTLHSSYEDISRSVSARGIGGFLGALLAGLVVDKLGPKKDWMLTISQALFTVVIVSIPFAVDLTLLWVLFFVLGTASGIVSVAGQRLLLEIWRENAASPMHAIHMAFGIGALLAPLIANPFLAVLDYTSENTTASTPKPGSETFTVIKESRVQLAYITIGVISFVLSLPFFIYPAIQSFMSYKEKTEYYNVDVTEDTADLEPKTFKQLFNPATYAAGSFKYGLFVFVWILLYYINLAGGEQLFGNFIRSYSVDQLKFTRDEASYLDTVFWGSFVVGRFIGALLAYYVSIKVLIPIDVTINLIAVTFLDIFSADNQMALWMFTIIVGITISPLCPATIAYTNTQIQVGGIVLTLVVFASGAGDFLYVWLAGHLYDTYGPRSLLYAIQYACTSVFIFAVIFLICGHYHGNRFVAEAKANDDSHVGEYTQLQDKPNRGISCQPDLKSTK